MKLVNKPIPEVVRSFLARQGKHRDRMEWEYGTIRYPVNTPTVRLDREATLEELDEYMRLLPLVVPGLKVVRGEIQESRLCGPCSYLWFTWSQEAMWARYLALAARYGVADPRLEYMQCSGRREGKFQLNLPGMPEVEPAVRGGRFIQSSWTRYGLMLMDSGFCQRIMYPNRGGPDCIPFNQEVEDGLDWWLVGSRGDSPEVLELEIKASPLPDRTKTNLLYNLSRRPLCLTFA